MIERNPNVDIKAANQKPTNEPKMPDVIYADNKQEAPNLRYCYHRQMDGTTTYHHDDKVQELRESLRDCVEAMKAQQIMSRRSEPFGKLDETLAWVQNDELAAKMVTEALTKASNLLK